MPFVKFALALVLACGCLRPAQAATWYVTTNGSDAAAGTNWAAAKQTIQAAVDLAAAGDTVLVSNGIYATGVRVTPGYATSNRVVITNDIVVQSVNGPAMTRIVGAYGGNYSLTSCVRCVYVTNGMLSGFTLTNGATSSSGFGPYNADGGGAYAEGGALSNCIITGCRAVGNGGGTRGGLLTDCTLIGNRGAGSASAGGGAYDGTLNNCILSSNSAAYGGGSSRGTLNNCTLTGNSVPQLGGGSIAGTLNNCTLSDNTALGEGGGGSYGGTLNNCVLTRNAAWDGSAAFNGTLNNCTIYSNYTSAAVYAGTQNNCIVYFNNAGNFDHTCTLNYSCTTPMPGRGTGSITNNPQLVALAGNNIRLRPGSPCLNAGLNAYATNWMTDFDGYPRILDGTVDVGAFEGARAVVSTAADPPGSGSVAGGGTLLVGSNAVLTATPASNWVFAGWVDGGTDAIRIITVPATDTLFTATFQTQAAGVAVTVLTNPVFGGSVIGNGVYAPGSNITLTATPAAFWRFVDWNDGVTNAERMVTVPDTNITFTANFTQQVSAVSLAADPAEGGTVAGGGTFPAGTDVQIGATANPGWLFTSWSDGDTNASRTLAVPETNIEFTAYFTQQVSTVTVVADPVNGGTVAGGGIFPVGSNIVIEAAPDAFWLFAGWSDGETSPVRAVAVPLTNISFTAIFSQRWAVLSVAAHPVQGGVAAGGESYPAGSLAALSATANRGWRFTAWSDGSTQAVRSVTVPLTGATYIASFRLRTRMDFDRDDRSDIAVLHPAAATWYVRRSSGPAEAPAVLGSPSAVAVAGDYDGDGTEDIAAYDAPSGNWIIRRSSSGAVTTNNWGWSAAAAVPADYDGDGITDLAVFHPATGNWYVRASGTGAMFGGAPIPFGWSASMPVPADYDGDGKADLAVYHPAAGAWYIRQSSTTSLMGGEPIRFGWSAAMPVPADYDGDGKADLAVYHPAAGAWYIRQSSTSLLMDGGPVAFGWGDAAPVPLDYDGDGLADLAVFHPAAGNWYIRKSSDRLLLGGGPINWGWRDVLPVMPQFQINRRFYPAP